MFKTNPPEFDPANEPRTDHTVAGAGREAEKSIEFETLAAFSDWLDDQLAILESQYEGFETVTSVRGFFGR
jgi:hypothetical protein